LYSLFYLALGSNCQVLGDDQSFRQKFSKPIEAAQQKDASDREISHGAKVLRELQELIKPYFLQRQREDYLSNTLPSSYEFDAWVKLSPKQRSLCVNYLSSDYSTIAIAENNRKCVLPMISKLRRICSHPYLDADSYKDLLQKHGAKAAIDASPKLALLTDLLDEWSADGHRTLVFSHSVQMLDIIEFALAEREGIKICRIDGSTPPKRRHLLVELFNGDQPMYNVMLLSVEAGGEGLTLVGASRSVIFDPCWNQAKSDQAVARINRPGQSRECETIHLIAAGTVEERVSCTRSNSILNFALSLWI